MLHLIRELIRLGKPGVLTVKVGGVLDRFDFGQCLTALRTAHSRLCGWNPLRTRCGLNDPRKPLNWLNAPTQTLKRNETPIFGQS